MDFRRKILSFDCGGQNMGMSAIEIISEELYEISEKCPLIPKFNIIKLHIFNPNVSHGQSDEEKLDRLHKYIQIAIPKNFFPTDVMIEEQYVNIEDKSRRADINHKISHMLGGMLKERFSNSRVRYTRAPISRFKGRYSHYQKEMLFREFGVNLLSDKRFFDDNDILSNKRILLDIESKGDYVHPIEAMFMALFSKI
jgi:hypothetical protein